jgi:hypothetical protein
MSGLRVVVASVSLALVMTACGGSDSSGTGIDNDDRSAMLESITDAGVDDATATCIVDALAEKLSPQDFQLIATAEIDADIPESIQETTAGVSVDCAAETAGLPAPSSDPAVTDVVESVENESVENETTVLEQTEGTTDNPIPLGSVAALPNGYDIVINSLTPAAGDAVASANEFNDPAPSGSQYVLVNLTVTYVGPDDKATPAYDLTLKAVSGSGASYDGTDCPAVVSEPAPLFDDLFAGSSVTGNVCLIVADADATDLTLYFDTYDDSFNTATYYFSVT